uniref:Uncharacterized protein AlNc14C289G10217 n=1 Tax=Albugo laibachii Nc14 TaxID=890382 RepID=F0WV72_9STRA|nr:conserved hypothetical protein [Albugo laibachii Nc14]|eukprot:CCA25311.1 conserved hypothetical protein [Albugo laibachii Nc14]
MVQPKWPFSVSVLRCSGLARINLFDGSVSRKETRLLFTFPSYSQPLIKSHSESKVVPFSANEMFDVVADVNSYKEFLPFCVESRVLRKPNENVMEAMLRIGFKIFTEAYTSRVIMNRPHKINIKSLESPTFKRIESEWQFKQLENPYSCQVQFRVVFEVASFLHANAIKLFFEDVARTQLNAFIGRAGWKYNANHERNENRKRREEITLQKKDQKLEETSLEDSNPYSKMQCTPPHASEDVRLIPNSDCVDPLERPLVSKQAIASIKATICTRDYEVLMHIFEKYAEDKTQLYFGGFCNACRSLGADYDTLKSISEDTVLAGAIFSSFETSREVKDWLDFDEFVVGVYLLTKGTVEEKAYNLFLTVDTSRDGRISRKELENAMQRRIHTVQTIFPKLLNDQIRVQMQSANVTSLPSTAESIMSEGLKLIETLMEDIEKDIPLAVNQIFSKADLDRDGYITEDEWLVAWQSHPELVELMTIDGMQKIAQWASVVKPDGNEDSTLDTRLTHID